MKRRVGNFILTQRAPAAGKGQRIRYWKKTQSST